MSSPATPQVVTSLEILQLVFEYLDPRDNYSNALVSKTWSNEALRILWREIQEFRHLASLLAPLSMLEESREVPSYRFTRPLQPSDWHRWNGYAWRVHSLKDIKWNNFSDHVLKSISESKPPLPLFPNLRALDYLGSLEYLPLFLTTNLTHLSFEASDTRLDGTVQPAELVNHFLFYVDHHTPHLESLRIVASLVSVEDVESTLASSLRPLRSLKSLSLPSHWFTETITQVISSLPKLKSINIIPLSTDADHTRTFLTTFNDGAFPALTSFSACMPLARALLTLSHPNKPVLLGSIHILSFGDETPDKYVKLIEVIAANYACISNLTLVTGPGPRSPAALEAAPIITWDMIRPLERCTGLVALRLHYIPSTFKLFLAGLVSLLKSLPALKSLHLNPTPQFLDDPIFTLGILIPILSTRPDLEELGLYIDAEGQFFPRADDAQAFTHLQMLSVGFSPITNPVAVAVFLARILPVDCTIRAVPRSLEEDGMYDMWEQVADFVPALVDARNEGRRMGCLC